MQTKLLKTKEEKASSLGKELDWQTPVLAGICASALSFVLLLAFAGGPFVWLRDELGLDVFFASGTGVYADCNLDKNKDNKYCRKEYSGILKPKKDYFYKSPKDWLPFTLNEESHY